MANVWCGIISSSVTCDSQGLFPFRYAAYLFLSEYCFWVGWLEIFQCYFAVTIVELDSVVEFLPQFMLLNIFVRYLYKLDWLPRTQPIGAALPQEHLRERIMAQRGTISFLLSP